MNKNVCYTVIFGDYDNLNDPKYLSENFDYVCITNNKNIHSNIWKIIYFDKQFENKIIQTKYQRYIKLHPHTYFKQYEFSIYVDGNIIIKNDLNIIKNYICNKKLSIYFKPHPQRNCTYMESFACACYGKDTLENTSKQLLKYWKEGFPQNYGLSETNIIGRYHNNENCIKLMEFWWNEILHNSHRDQLSLFYSIWKLNLKNDIYIFNENDMKHIKNTFFCDYNHNS